MSTGETIYSIRALLLQWMSGAELDQASRSRLQQWAEASEQNRLLLQQLKNDHWIAGELDKINKLRTAQQWQDLTKKLHEKKIPALTAPVGEEVLLERPALDEQAVPDEKGAPLRRIPHWRRWRIAAAALLLGAAGLGLLKWRSVKNQTAERLVDHLATPAGIAATRATLTLADGSVMVLDNTRHQFRLSQQGNQILQEEGRRLIYFPAADPGAATAGANAADAKEAYNILTVPHGMQFELVLADGTKVWVNDGSSVRYPVAFAEKQRDVELKGEAYFEVTHSEKLPFRVRTPSLMTVVLGTHFNVRDYPAEHHPRTTLLEGKVMVRKGDNTATLDKPGQEAQALEGTPGFQIFPVDLEARMAWKNGYFYFDNLDIRSSLEEVARWYQKKLVFKDNTEKAQLGKGKVTRNQPLHQLLENIERSDLHFQYGDSTIIVSR